jgi:hypothetical protein
MNQTNESKAWWQSSGIWGGIAAGAAGIAGVFGVHWDAGQLTLILTDSVAIAGAVIAIIGRVKATLRIG